MAKTMSRAKRAPEEVRERAVRRVLEHEEQYASQWQAIRAIAVKVGCSAERGSVHLP